MIFFRTIELSNILCSNLLNDKNQNKTNKTSTIARKNLSETSIKSEKKTDYGKDRRPVAQALIVRLLKDAN